MTPCGTASPYTTKTAPPFANCIAPAAASLGFTRRLRSMCCCERRTCFRPKITPRCCGNTCGWRLWKPIATIVTRAGRCWWERSEIYVLLRAANVLPPEDHTALLREYLRLAPLETDRHDRDQSRVVLVGTFCEQPPLGLLLTLERAGCWVVDDDLLQIGRASCREAV